MLGTAQVAGTLQADRSALKSGDVPFTAPQNDNVPSLPQMTDAALNVLSNASDEGFFVMIEGGAIDWASHDNNTAGAVEEQVDFNRTIETVVDWVEENSSWDETLVVITADHECGYLSGPAANPAWTPIQGAQGEAPQVSWNSGGHTNHLVPVYAKGPGSEQLAAAATGTDPVRGAYLDNADVGRVSNALWAANDTDGIPLLATVPEVGEVGGKLTLSVADFGAGVALTGGENVGDRLRFGRAPRGLGDGLPRDRNGRHGRLDRLGPVRRPVVGPRTLRAQNLGWTPAWSRRRTAWPPVRPSPRSWAVARASRLRQRSRPRRRTAAWAPRRSRPTWRSRSPSTPARATTRAP
ncbi:alkaline phosphatase [Oerskovia sp. M15]